MSQSYHEIFDSQAYLQAQAKAENQTHQAEIATETPTQAGDIQSAQEDHEPRSDEAMRKETKLKEAETGKRTHIIEREFRGFSFHRCLMSSLFVLSSVLMVLK